MQLHGVDHRHLTALEAVVRTGSFLAAAQALGYTQSAISQQIAELEHRVGMRVVDRRPVRPTAAGTVLLGAQRSWQASIAAAGQELTALQEGLTGQVRIAAFASAAVSIVPQALARFRQTNPDVRVAFSQLEADASYAQLQRGGLDLALTFDYDKVPYPAPDGVLRTLITKDPVLVAMPAGHHLADRDAVKLASMAAEDWIVAPLAGLQPSLLAELTRSPGFQPRLHYAGDDFQTVLSLVAHGLGIAVLPQLAVRRIPPGVTIRPITGTPLTRFLYTARLDTRHLPSALLALEAQLAHAAAS